MDNEVLKENIESFERVIGNLEDYIFDQTGMIDKIQITITDAEEDIRVLTDLKDAYTKLLKEKE